MDAEAIIRKEAKEFYEWNIDQSNIPNSITIFHEIKKRLADFYTPENKAIFLDEIESQIKKELGLHRIQAHDGQPNPNCNQEIKTEKLLFYIMQEVETLPKIAHQKFNFKDKDLRTKVFISYSHLDKSILSDIQRHFKPFLKQIDYWDDSQIQPGQKWKDEIIKAICHTKVAILLVSTDFLGSDFIISNELPPLLKAAEQEGAVILTLILKPCLFEKFNDLNQFQTLNPPNRPMTKMNYDEKEELLVNLVRQTKKILDK